jgi:hypothetical protein
LLDKILTRLYFHQGFTVLQQLGVGAPHLRHRSWLLAALILASFGKILSKLWLIFYYKNSKNARLKFSKDGK